MKKFLLLLASVLLFSVSLADTTSVRSTEVDGNKRIDTAAIKLQLKKTTGTITTEEINDNIKTLYRTGFFDQVTASLRNDNTLVYTVVEKPVVRKIFVKGNKEVKESDLVDVFDFGAQRFLDKGRLEALARAGVSYYQTRGYFDAEVDHSIVSVGENQVDVTFDVKEGDRYKINRIEFLGAEDLDESELRAAIETKKYKWWSSWLTGTGRLNKAILDNDKGAIRQYFLDNGYIDATVSDPTIERDGTGLKISFTINEGSQYKIGNVTASGDLVNKSASDTIDGVELKSGETFNASKIRNDSFKISQKFSDVGFAFVNVVPDTRVNRSTNTVDLDYKISKGKKVTVDKINIKGNVKTYDNVIRRELRIAEKEIFSSKKIERSEALLKRLGYFEEVSISPEPTQSDDTVNLGVNVREAPTGSFSVGAGYSTSDGVLGNARLSENNIFGTGRKLDLDVVLGDQRENFQLSLEDPRFNDTYMSAGIDGYKSRRQFSDFDRNLTGGNVTFGYPLEEVFGENFEDIKASLQYELFNIKIDEVDKESAADLVIDSEGSSTASGFIPQLTRNTIDNPLNPNKGSKQSISTEVTGAGGDEEYYLLEARNQWYYPFLDTKFGNFVFSWRTRVGYGDTMGSGEEKFPLFRRYFPGGIDSVRGYDARTLGPKDDRGNEFGGSKQFINNFEIIFPLVNSAGLKGIAFYDLGEAFDDDKSINFGELRKAYGTGIRWQSPIGPIRIEFGFPIGREEGEDSMQTHFSFGAPL